MLVAELVVTARVQRLTGENDALLARMRNHMTYTLASGRGAAGRRPRDGGRGRGGGRFAADPSGLPGFGAAPGASQGASEAEGGEEGSNADSSQDGWFEPAAYCRR